MEDGVEDGVEDGEMCMMYMFSLLRILMMMCFVCYVY